MDKNTEQEIKQGLKEISEGKVVPLSSIEPQPRLEYPDCCIGCEYAYKNEALQIDCACLHTPPANCHLNKPQPDQSPYYSTVAETLAYEEGMREMARECQAQRDLTASIKDAECREYANELRRDYEDGVKRAKEFVRAECQARIEALMSEIEKSYIDYIWNEFGLKVINVPWPEITAKYLKANPTSEVEG